MDITYGCMYTRSEARTADSGPQYRDARVDDTNRRRPTVSLRHSDQPPRPVHIPACSVQYTGVQELNGYNTASRGPCGHNHWKWPFRRSPGIRRTGPGDSTSLLGPCAGQQIFLVDLLSHSPHRLRLRVVSAVSAMAHSDGGYKALTTCRRVARARVRAGSDVASSQRNLCCRLLRHTDDDSCHSGRRRPRGRMYILLCPRHPSGG